MKNQHQRRGAILVLAAVCMIIMGVILAFTIDFGLLLSARTEMQRSADAAALAGAWEMVSDDLVRSEINTTTITSTALAARQMAVGIAAMNQVVQTNPYLDIDGDIDLGYLANPSDHNESLSFSETGEFNTIQVRIQYSANNNTPISLFFAPLIGISSADLAVSAAATFSGDGTSGFRVTDQTGNSTLLPFVVKSSDWESFLTGNSPDNWTVDPETGTITAGEDGIPEMSVSPDNDVVNALGEVVHIAPGNFGMIDIGNTNNAAGDLIRQILEGPSPEDFAFYDNNELKLDPVTGTVAVNGDTGMTVSMNDALAAIVGQARTILLYESVSGTGNTAEFIINGFAGVRILDFRLTGNNKFLLIQPSIVADHSAISGDSGSSYFVGPPVHLVR